MEESAYLRRVDGARALLVAHPAPTSSSVSWTDMSDAAAGNPGSPPGINKLFFLRLPSGDLEVELFEPVERPVGEERARQMAAAVDRTGASAVVMVSEAWSANHDDVPPGSGAGDGPNADDVVLVAAVDSQGNEVVLETPVVRRPDGTVRPDGCAHVVAVREKPPGRLQSLEVRVGVLDVPFAVIADGEEPDHSGFAVVPRRSAPPADVQRERDDLGQERADRLLPGRPYVSATLAERRDDFVRGGELVHRPIDAFGRKTEVFGQAPLGDTRDELAAADLHGPQA